MGECEWSIIAMKNHPIPPLLITSKKRKGYGDVLFFLSDAPMWHYLAMGLQYPLASFGYLTNIA